MYLFLGVMKCLGFGIPCCCNAWNTLLLQLTRSLPRLRTVVAGQRYVALLSKRQPLAAQITVHQAQKATDRNA
jgi:hypothetical protein